MKLIKAETLTSLLPRNTLSLGKTEPWPHCWVIATPSRTAVKVPLLRPELQAAGPGPYLSGPQQVSPAEPAPDKVTRTQRGIARHTGCLCVHHKLPRAQGAAPKLKRFCAMGLPGHAPPPRPICACQAAGQPCTSRTFLSACLFQEGQRVTSACCCHRTRPARSSELALQALPHGITGVLS